ncbi:MAG: alpha/beta hydrolase [Candidatus Latescibacterota bacterium]|jgi:pimeloyl-ACP methyl ester carboxylesterase
MKFRFLFLCLLALTSSCSNDATGPTNDVDARFLSADPIEFSTSDGFLIRGTFFHDKSETTAKPVIILLHAFNRSHLDWFTFAPELVDNKDFVVLAIDLRGHGESIFQNGVAFPIQTFSSADLNSMPLDIEAAVAYLKTRPEADATRIGIVGADIGANLAYIGTGILTEIKAAVSISPQFRENLTQGILTGDNLPNFQPHNILYIASFGDGYAYTSSQTMSERTQGNTRVLGLQGLAHGMDILTSNETWTEVMNWLSSNLQ